MNEAYERSVLRLLTAIQNAVGAAGKHQGWEAGYLIIPKPGDLDPDNQEVAAEVCRTTGMTAERWDRLTLAERAPWVEQAAGVWEAAASASASSSPTPQQQTEVSFLTEADLPAEFREGGKPGGEPLTAAYTADNPVWQLNGAYLSKAWKAGRLTRRANVGNQKFYCWRELLPLREELQERKAKKHDPDG